MDGTETTNPVPEPTPPAVDAGAVEAVLRGAPGVLDAAAVAREEPSGRVRMVAWLAVEPGAAPDEAALREQLLESLPGHVLPSVFVVVGSLPRHADGSVDADALPPPPEVAFTAPEDETETAIAAVWAEVLGVERVGVHDNFFDLGGQSVLLLQVHARLSAVLGNNVPVILLFKHPTVHSLAAALARGGDASQGEEETTRTGQERAESRREMRNRRQQTRRGR